MNVSKFEIKEFLPYIFVIFIIVGVIFKPIAILTFLLMALYVLYENRAYSILEMLFFCMSFASAFKLSAESTSLFTFIQLIAVIKLSMTIKFKRKFFLAFFVYVVYLFIGIGGSYIEVIKQITYPLLVYFCMDEQVVQNSDKCASWYCKGVIVSSIIGLFRNYIPNLSTIVNEKVTRLEYEVYTNRFSGLIGDPNYYSVSLMLAFSLIFFLFVKGKISGIIAYSSFIAFIVFGAMTGSKTFLLMLGIVILFAFVELLKNKKYITSGLMLFAIIFSGLLVFNGKLSLFNTIISRLTEASTMSELTTERTDLWKMYASNLLEHPFKLIIGNGFGKGYSFDRFPHNTYLDFIDILGVFGTILFLYTRHCACFLYIKARKVLNYIPLIVIIIMYFTLSMILHYNMVYHIMLATMIIYYNEENFELNQHDTEGIKDEQQNRSVYDISGH